MNGTGVPDVSAATSRTSSPASAGSASRTDRMAPMTSHTSGPPTSLARRPAGPSLNVMSGCSRIRSASSTSLLVALDRVRSRCAATNAESRSNTPGSNRTDDGPEVVTMYDNVGECMRPCKVAGQGMCGSDGAGHPAGGYCASMGDDWRVRIAFDEDDPPELPESGEQALVAALRSRLSDQVAVTSNDTEIFLYASAAGSADQTAQVARQVLARHDVSASVRTEFWSSLHEEWRDVTDEPSADPVAERRAAGREISRKAGFPAWQVRADVRSHRDVVALAGYLAAQGWQVRRRRRHLFVGADCEDDAQGLVRELCGDGSADAETAFRVRRVSYSYMLFDPFGTQVFGGTG